MSGVKGRSGPRKPLGKQIDEAMKRLDEGLPALISRLMKKAEEGDREALIYLIDRRMGKPRQQTELDITGGDKLGANLLVELFQIMAQKKRELETTIKVEEITSGTDRTGEEGLSEGIHETEEV